MSKYKSRLLQSVEGKERIAFLDVFDPLVREAVDFNDFPKAMTRITALCDSCDGIKYDENIEASDLASDGHTIKHLELLDKAPDMSLYLTVKLTGKPEDNDELLEDLKQLKKVQVRQFILILTAGEDMTWQQEKEPASGIGEKGQPHGASKEVGCQCRCAQLTPIGQANQHHGKSLPSNRYWCKRQSERKL